MFTSNLEYCMIKALFISALQLPTKNSTNITACKNDGNLTDCVVVNGVLRVPVVSCIYQICYGGNADTDVNGP